MTGKYSEQKHEYRRVNFRRLLFVIVCLVCTFIAFFVSMMFGLYPLSFEEVYSTFFNCLLGNPVDDTLYSVVWEIRTPEALMAILVGVILAAGGCVMQTILRNPLADPYTMGVSSGASLGAAIAIIFGFCIIPGVSGDLAIVIDAFTMSLIPVVLILLFSSSRHVTQSRMILVGIGVMYVFSAATSLLMVTTDEQKLSSIYTWNVGTVAGSTWNEVFIVFIAAVIGVSILLFLNKKIDVIISGPRMAKTLGVHAKKLSGLLMGVVALMVATAVCFTGTVGFVGLVAPNVARIFVGSKTSHLIPASLAIGSLFLLICNSIARVSAGSGLPVGVICSIFGGPIFVIILMKFRTKAWA